MCMTTRSCYRITQSGSRHPASNRVPRLEPAFLSAAHADKNAGFPSDSRWATHESCNGKFRDECLAT